MSKWNPVCSDTVLTRRKPLLLFRDIQHLTAERSRTKSLFRKSLKCLVVSQCNDSYLHDLFFHGRAARCATAPVRPPLRSAHYSFDRVLTRRKPLMQSPFAGSLRPRRSDEVQ